jgi:EpsI family protein
MIRFTVALAFIGLNFYTYNFFASTPLIPERERFESFPLEIDEWACPEREMMEPDVEQNLGVTDYLICTYSRERPRESVSVYIGYHKTQVREEGGGAGENSIHPPAHCLPGSGWDIIDNRTVPLDIEGLPQRGATAKRLVIAKGRARQLVYYWYQSRGRVISEDWKKIVYVGADRALRGRTDGSLVRFTLPIRRDDVESADAAFFDLAPRLLPHLGAYVPE